MNDILPVVPLTVADLILHLQTLPQGLPVCYCIHSEMDLLELKHLEIVRAQVWRPDGWVHLPRPDRESIDYLCLPGN